MSIVAYIPVRMDSTRFPGKPLAPILGISMVEHVFQRTRLCNALDGVCVVTPDDEIREVVEGFGGRVVMTSPDHQRASDRVAEAMESVPADIAVMVQGDEPMVHPDMIAAAVAPFTEDGNVGCVNLVQRIESEEEFEDTNTIKVVMDRKGNALYFSRKPIPFRREDAIPGLHRYKQVCIIPFTRDALLLFSRLEPTPLEVAESVDMMRFLEHGYDVKLVESPFPTHAVDTPDDLRRVEELLRNDPLLAKYKRETP